jgi:flagellar motor switch protein FliM
MREVLDAGVASDRVEKDERWMNCLREEMEDAEIELTTILGRSSLTLAELLNLKSGDVLPCDFSGKVTVVAEDVPVFRGGLGISRGRKAVKVQERIRRGKSAGESPAFSGK